MGRARGAARALGLSSVLALLGVLTCPWEETSAKSRQSLVSSPTTASLLHAEPWAAELSGLGHCTFLVSGVTLYF